jgi:TPR repeat protein
MSENGVSREKRDYLRRIKEARIGDINAQFEVALLYANGLGVTKSLEQALVWTQAAADKGHVAAQYLLGRTYQQGLGVGKDPQRALVWYQKAAEAGNEKATLSLAKFYAEPQAAVAFHYAFESAEAGFAEAQFTLGEFYAKGFGTRVDAAHACVWFSNAAKQGHAHAEYELGRAFEHGLGMEKNIAQACDWYRLAAKQGLPAAQLALEHFDVASHSLGRGRKSGKRLVSRERRLADSRWIKFASKGNRDDFFNLGLMFEKGIGVERSVKQARLWYQKAAEHGHPDAMVALASILDKDQSIEAARWRFKAAVLGQAEAQHELAQELAKGTGDNRDQDLCEALTWLSLSARQGYSPSQWDLSELIRSRPDDLQKALTMAAARSGQPQAQYAMGQLCAGGVGVVQDNFQACQWYQLAAEQGLASAQYALALCFSSGLGVKTDLAKAFLWFEKAAAQEHPGAQWSLGELYATGIPGINPDVKQASLLCKRAANAGFAPAQATLGTLFAKAKKFQRAAHWWGMAAEQGDPEALFNLSQAYRLGNGVEKDAVKAFELILEAAEGGLAVAQAQVGLAYATGEGAVLDSIESAKWFILASRGGDESAKANQTRAKKILSPAQWAEASRRAEAWKPALKK